MEPRPQTPTYQSERSPLGHHLGHVDGNGRLEGGFNPRFLQDVEFVWPFAVTSLGHRLLFDRCRMRLAGEQARTGGGEGTRHDPGRNDDA